MNPTSTAQLRAGAEPADGAEPGGAVRLVATYAHRGRGRVHLAAIIAAHPTDPGLRLLNTSALCGASTAVGVMRGQRIRGSVRPGESIGLHPDCRKCLDAVSRLDVGFTPPGRVISRAYLNFEFAPGSGVRHA